MGSVMLSAEQVARLESVDLDALKATQLAEKHERMLILGIDRRLVAWAEWLYSAERRKVSVGGCGSVMGALVDSQGVFARSTNPNSGGMPDDIYDIDRLVRGLPADEGQVVRVNYLQSENGQVANAAACGMSERTFRRKLRGAQQKILFSLKVPSRLRSRRS